MISLVCGRGESLKSFIDYIDKELDFIYLINEFNKFIIENPNLLSFFKKKQSEGTKIIQITNIEMQGIDKKFIEAMNLHEVYSTRMNHTGEKVWWRDYYDPNRFKSSLGITVKPQPEVLEPFMHKIGNSLPIAMLNAILVNDSKEIHIIGKDFYESFYYTDENDRWSTSQWPNENTPKTQNRLKNEFTEFVKMFPEITFKITTQSSYENKLANCEIIKITR